MRRENSSLFSSIFTRWKAGDDDDDDDEEDSEDDDEKDISLLLAQ